MHEGVFQALPGRSRGLQGPPGASGAPEISLHGFERKMRRPRTAKANFTRDGQAGLGHPPWRGVAGGGPG